MSEQSLPRRRSSSRRPHPWLFMLALGTMCAAIVDGDAGVALLCGLVVLFTLGVL